MKVSKEHRKLLTSQQFRAVYDRGQKFNTPFFSAFILKTNSDRQRIGITVTRKLGGAVVRNRCKRRIKEVLRRYRHLAFGHTGYDMVINAKADLLTADYKQVEDAVAQTLTRFRRSCLNQGG